MPEHAGSVEEQLIAGVSTEQTIADHLAGGDVIAVYRHPVDLRNIYRALLTQLSGVIAIAAPARPSKKEALLSEEERERLRYLNGIDGKALKKKIGGSPAAWVYEHGEAWLDAGLTLPRTTELRAQLPAPTLVLTPRADIDFLRRLGARVKLKHPSILFNRFFGDNLRFEVARQPTPERQLEVATRIAGEFRGKAVFFVENARAARELAVRLRTEGVESRAHFGQMRVHDRAAAVEDFLEDRAKALVTTRPFYPPVAADNVAFIVHMGLPENLENYYLDVVRITGDDKPARAMLLVHRLDKRLQKVNAPSKSEPTVADITEAMRVLRAYPDAEKSGVTVQIMATALSQGVKRTQMTLQMLKEAGAADETARGRYRPAGAFEPEEVARVIVRHRVARDRQIKQVKELLHYVDTGLCREKALRRAFGIEEEQVCGRCDNCRRGTERKARHEAKRLSAGRHEHERHWCRGDLVVHDNWGEGEVKEVWSDKVRVHFPGQGEKVLKSEFVRPAG